MTAAARATLRRSMLATSLKRIATVRPAGGSALNVRCLHVTSFTWRGALGTPPVLLAIAVVVVGQLAFTYLPVLQGLLATKPISFADGLLIIGVGILATAILEAKEPLMRRLGLLVRRSTL